MFRRHRTATRKPGSIAHQHSRRHQPQAPDLYHRGNLPAARRGPPTRVAPEPATRLPNRDRQAGTTGLGRAFGTIDRDPVASVACSRMPAAVESERRWSPCSPGGRASRKTAGSSRCSRTTSPCPTFRPFRAGAESGNDGSQTLDCCLRDRDTAVARRPRAVAPPGGCGAGQPCFSGSGSGGGGSMTLCAHAIASAAQRSA